MAILPIKKLGQENKVMLESEQALSESSKLQLSACVLVEA